MRTRPLLALLAASLLPACDGDGGGRRTASDEPPAGPAPAPSEPAGGGGSPAALNGATLGATLGGGQAGTPSPARGRAIVFVPDDGSMIEYTLEVRGLTSPGAARLRLGELGREGPILFELPAAEGRLLPQDLRPAGDVRSFPEALAALRAGRVHVGVSTDAYPEGELRGQIGPATLKARFGAASGYALLRMNGRQDAIAFELWAAGLSGPPVGAWIQIGRDGPPFLGALVRPLRDPAPGDAGARRAPAAPSGRGVRVRGRGRRPPARRRRGGRAHDVAPRGRALRPGDALRRLTYFDRRSRTFFVTRTTTGSFPRRPWAQSVLPTVTTVPPRA